MWFKHLILVHVCAAFPLKCPEPAQWALRANSHCTDPSKYYCLQNDLIQGFSENCTRSDFQQPGRKAVLRGGIDADICSQERYQPFPIRFYTNVSTHCLFLKSLCNEEGQVVNSRGNRNTDITCTCDYRRGYAFLVKPKKNCFCKPKQEDCSCFLKTCSNSSHILSEDYQCIYANHAPVKQCRPITAEKDNISKRTEQSGNTTKEDNAYFLEPWENSSASVVHIIFGCTVVVCIVLSIRSLRKYCFRAMFTSELKPISCVQGEMLQLKCSVYSNNINVEWFKEDQKIVQNQKISIYNDGKDHFLTVRYAEMCDSGQYVIHAGTARKELQVDITALPEAINRLSEKDRIKYIELIQNSKTEKRYFVRVMIVGKESVGKTCLLRRLLKEPIDDVSSTDGIDIVVRRCKINIEDGKWTIEKDISDDRLDRIQRAILQPQSSKNEDMKNPDTTEAQVQNKMHSKTFLSKPGTPMVNKKNTDLTGKRNISSLDKVILSSNIIDDIYDSESDESNVNDSENETNSDTTEKVETKKSLPLLMPSNLISGVFSTSSASNNPTNHYALCGLWDFAGQKEFYATHQAFLTNTAIYLVVADMDEDIVKRDITKCFADFCNVGEYVDFWFESIHCHATVELPDKERNNDYIEPPVFIVFTGKDKCEKANSGKNNIEKRKLQLQNQLDMVLGQQSKFHHLRKIFWLSNKTDPREEFEKLQLEISVTAQKMKNWGQEIPLKWILLEQLIDINKTKGKNFINLSDMINLAKHEDINVQDIDEVFLFLRFQHEEGNIIYFDDIQDFIILNPKWLADAFRCLVSDKIVDSLQHRADWTEYQRNGCISEELITKLFEIKSGSQFAEQRNHLLEIMEKFDILVKICETHSYIIPSMMPFASFDVVCKNIGIENSNCKRSSWLCLKFSFLPPAFFNHFSVWFIKKYIFNIQGNELKSLPLFRGICLFNLDRSGCEKLLTTMSTDRIALQLLSFSTGQNKIETMCSRIRKDIIQKTKAIIERYNLKISYELHFKCSTGNFYEDTMSFECLKSLKEYHCNQHREVHQSENVYMPWMLNEDEATINDELKRKVINTNMTTKKLPMTLNELNNTDIQQDTSRLIIPETLHNVLPANEHGFQNEGSIDSCLSPVETSYNTVEINIDEYIRNLTDHPVRKKLAKMMSTDEPDEDLDIKNMEHYLLVAKRLNLRNSLINCEKKLISNLNQVNCYVYYNLAEEYEFENLKSAALASINKTEISGACSKLTNSIGGSEDISVTKNYKNYLCFFTIGTFGLKRTITVIVYDSDMRKMCYRDLMKGKQISKLFQCCCFQDDENNPPIVYWSFGSSVYQFDPLMNKFKQRSSLYCKRAKFNMISHENHCYVIGGVYIKRKVLEIEKYNTKKNSWKKVAYLPGDSLPVNPSCVVFDGLIYIFSAILDIEGNIKPTATAVYVFHPRTKSVKQVAEIPFSFRHMKTCVVDSFIYIASDQKHFIRFCPSDGSCLSLPDQIEECKDFGMIAMDTSICIAGGYCRGKELKDINVFCTVSGHWETLSEKLPNGMAIYDTCELKIPNSAGSKVPFYETDLFEKV